VLLSVSLVRDDDGAPLHLIAHIQDVTEQRALEARLQERADRDELTGLVNRRRFGEELTRQLARTARHAEPAALAMIDLDGFKAVNDKLGHAAGDEVLRAVATALADRVRETDMVARLGGDEFAALLVGVDESQLSDMAALLRKTAAEASRGSGVTASVGVTTLLASDDVDEALARADRAMYAAKSDSAVHGLGPGGAGIVAPSGR
jgi:diguanylate cyclase (GGDEF)-like protein